MATNRSQVRRSTIADTSPRATGGTRRRAFGATTTYATAGHPPPVLAQVDKPARFLSYEGIPLGIAPSADYRTFVIQATDGALLVFYTDGIVEHARNILTGEQELLEAARDCVAHTDPSLGRVFKVKFEGFSDGGVRIGMQCRAICSPTNSGPYFNPCFRQRNRRWVDHRSAIAAFSTAFSG